MAFLDWSDSFNTMTQTLTTTIGETYTVSYWVASDHPNLLQVTFGGSTLFDGTAPTTGGSYVEYSYNSVATSTSTILTFSGRRTSGGVTLLDDVSVTAEGGAPEPATWLLAAAPLIGLAVSRRRNR
jgi:hypothetical protein